MMKRLLTTLLLALVAIGVASAARQRSAPSGEWPTYGREPGNSRYSPLDQIGPATLPSVEIAWRWPQAAPGQAPEFRNESTPIMIGGTLYFTSGSERSGTRWTGASAASKSEPSTRIWPSEA